MNVLALECCFGAVSVAIGACDPAGGGRVLAAAYEERATGHAERLLPMLEAAMAESGLGFGEISRIAVTVGPGSFTGVRTGIAAARALALATGAEVVGATSLAALFWRAAALGPIPVGRPVVVAVDARRGDVYVQGFDGGGEARSEPEVLAVAAAAARLPDDAIVIGNGGPLLAASLGAGRANGLRLVGERLEPRAEDLVLRASALPRQSPVQPLYIRAPDAKPQAASGIPRA